MWLQETTTGHTCPEKYVIEHTLLTECVSLYKEIALMMAPHIKSKITKNKVNKDSPVRPKTSLEGRKKRRKNNGTR